MDTNAIFQLIAALKNEPIAASGVTGGMTVGVQITVIILAGLSPIIAAAAAWFAKRAVMRSATSQVELAATVEKIHIAVNSERTSTLAEIKSLRSDVLDITRQKMALEERVREFQRKDAERTNPKSEEQVSVTGHDLIQKLSALVEGYTKPLQPHK